MNARPHHRPLSTTLFTCLLAGGFAGTAAAQDMPMDHEGHEQMMAMAAAEADTVASRSGDWNDNRTWSTGAVPADGATVRIPDGRNVVVRNQESTSLAQVIVEGGLSFDTARDTRLTVDTMTIASTGRVTIGTQQDPLQSGRSAEILIKSNNNAPFIVDRSRGILGAGVFETFAADRRLNKARLSGDALSGDQSITLADNPAGWRIGDELVVTGTVYRPLTTGRGGVIANLPPLENEVRQITAINGKTVTFNGQLNYDHVRAASDLSIYVSNLTRPITVRSANRSPVSERGHVMFMAGAKVNINDVGFYDLGRTRKDLDVSATNPLRVYSVHFHRNGYSQRQIVANSVIRGTPGWGLVNHSSFLDASDNVVHDFAGSAFVSEAGDEIGSFTGNIASGGTNQPQDFKVVAREAINPGQRERLRQGDMGKFAQGFWMVSPQVVVQNNVVAASRGTAYFQFGLGTVEKMNPNDANAIGQLTGFPLDRFPAGINPSTWKYRNQFTNAPMGLTCDLPINGFRDNIAYGVFQGMRLRWSNDSCGFLISKKGVRIGDWQAEQLVRSPNTKRQLAVLSNFTVWNSPSGFNAGYSQSFDLANFRILKAQNVSFSGCGASDKGKICYESGISLDAGMGGNTTRVTNTSINNILRPLEFGDKANPSSSGLTVDGKPVNL